MRLVIFDIDGTLTHTVRADDECFVRALAEVHAIHDVETDWSCYKHATDAGIFHEVHEARLGRPPSEDDISRFRRHFVELLARASAEHAFAPVPGAPQLLARLLDSADYRVALATGAWSDSARIKLASAGMRFEEYPAASSDDAMDRASIIKRAIERAVERYGLIESAVYVGDAVWDARASRSIGLPFIGIASGARASRLTAEGAAFVFPDLSDADLFVRSLRRIANGD